MIGVYCDGYIAKLGRVISVSCGVHVAKLGFVINVCCGVHIAVWSVFVVKIISLN